MLKSLPLIFLILCAGCTQLQEIEVADKVLYESMYAPDVLPPCIPEASSYYKVNICYRSNHSEDSDDFMILYKNFMGAVSVAEEKHSESGESVEKEVLYREAACSIGVRLSCALNRILVKSGVNMDAGWVPELISGNAKDLGEELSFAVYPVNYSPTNFSQFKDVLIKGIEFFVKN